MKGRTITLILLLFLGVDMFSQDAPAPALQCVEVLPNNNIRLKWQQPSYSDIINNFPGCPTVEYTIYRSNAIDGTYLPIGTINHDQDLASLPVFFTDTDAQADQVGRYYFIELLYFGVCGAVNSNKMAAMFLMLDGGSTAIQSTVDLNWNIENIVNGPSVNIEENVDGSGWGTIHTDNTSANTYSKKNDHCSFPDPSIAIQYRLRIDSPDCADPVYSNVVNGLFKDDNAPELPFIQTVSVDCATGNTVIYWDYSISNDVTGYYIQNDGLITVQEITNGSQNIAFVNSPFATDPDLGPATYLVVPYDDCIQDNGVTNTAGANLDALTSTMWLQGNYVECSRTIDLNWTPYVDWASGVQRYVINRILDDGTIEFVESVSGSMSNFTVDNVEENVNYNLVVTAIPNDTQLINHESWSNKYFVFTEYHDVTQNFDIEEVTVVNRSETQIKFSIDQSVGGQSYRLEKLNAFGDGFESLVTIPQDLATGGLFTYSDFGVNNDQEGDQYRLIGIDKCGNDVGMSDVSNSLHLEGFADDGTLENVLSWNEYLTWDEGVQWYEVFFSHGDQMPIDPEFVITESSTTFKTHQIEEFLHTESDFCYMIKALEKNGPGVSESNIKCVNQTQLFFLPNAIVLNGQNPVFKPAGGFIEFETYEMTVFDRWGKLMFKTNDFFQGWDGTYRNEEVREGVYAYFIKYNAGGGQEVVRSGALTVLQAY